MVSLTMDSIKVLAFEHQKIERERRSKVINALHSDYKQLRLVKDDEDTEFIFGPDKELEKKLGTMDKAAVRLREPFRKRFKPNNPQPNDSITKNTVPPQKSQWKAKQSKAWPQQGYHKKGKQNY